MIIQNNTLSDQEVFIIKPFSKINKYIEIVTTPNSLTKTDMKDDLNVELILEILSKNYEKVLVTTIKNEDDLKTLITKKPDLVFSRIKYFNLKKEKIWFSDYLKKHNIDYISSNKNAFENEYDKNLAKVIAIDEDGKESDVVFSKVLGEKCTYSIHKKDIEAFGDHKDNYMKNL